jgi:N-formylglutamate deformylase
LSRSPRPQWVVLHVPHDSTVLPDEVRDQYVLDDMQLEHELRVMTDHHTYALFGADESPEFAVRAPVSRLVVDMERFEDDEAEPMARRGMGVIYTRGSNGQRLRRDLAPLERQTLLESYYHPHHAQLDETVTRILDVHGRCLVLDCHSFPAIALPYEQVQSAHKRPDICIGSDDFHTPPRLLQAFVSEFERVGWSVAVNDPFSGALVPAPYYRRDARVTGIMVEVNRRLYLDEINATPLRDFLDIRESVISCCASAISRGV